MITKEKLAFVIEENREYLLKLACSITLNEYDAQDALGETILKAFENIERIRKPSKIKSWLCAVVVNKAKDILYKHNAEGIVHDVDEMDIMWEDVSLSPENIFLWQIIRSLSDEQRELVFLYYIENHSVNEIREMMGVPAGTIKTRLAQIRKVLYRKLKEGEQQEW